MTAASKTFAFVIRGAPEMAIDVHKHLIEPPPPQW
jgi:hypothetical protein